MSAVKLTIHGTGRGTCSLSGKDGVDGLAVTFEDGTTANQFLGWKAFQQLLRLKTGTVTAEPTPAPPARDYESATE